jgi:hypothetical protein
MAYSFTIPSQPKLPNPPPSMQSNHNCWDVVTQKPDHAFVLVAWMDCPYHCTLSDRLDGLSLPLYIKTTTLPMLLTYPYSILYPYHT